MRLTAYVCFLTSVLFYTNLGCDDKPLSMGMHVTESQSGIAPSLRFACAASDTIIDAQSVAIAGRQQVAKVSEACTCYADLHRCRAFEFEWTCL